MMSDLRLQKGAEWAQNRALFASKSRAGSGMGEEKDAPSISSESEILKSQSEMSFAIGGPRPSGSLKTISTTHREGPLDRRRARLVRRTLYELVESDFFNYFILAVITLNSLILGLQTSQTMVKAFEFYFLLIENVFLGVYLWELMIKLYAYRLQYFNSYWNNFDIIIIGLSLFAWLLQGLANISETVSNMIAIIRVFRIVRIIRFLYELKKVKYLKSLQIIIETLFKSLPIILNIACLAGIFLYVTAVGAMIMYGKTDPRRFGSFGKSIVRLFQVITLDRWSEIYTDNKDAAPGIWALGFVLIILETFVFENLFVAVIVTNLQRSRDLTEMKRQKRLRRHTKTFLDDDRQSKTSLNASRMSENELENLFDEQHELDHYYPSSMSNRLKELTSTYFMNLASLEHAMCSYQRHQKILDDLVDLAKKHQENEL